MGAPSSASTQRADVRGRRARRRGVQRLHRRLVRGCAAPRARRRRRSWPSARPWRRVRAASRGPRRRSARSRPRCNRAARRLRSSRPWRPAARTSRAAPAVPCARRPPDAIRRARGSARQAPAQLRSRQSTFPSALSSKRACGREPPRERDGRPHAARVGGPRPGPVVRRSRDRRSCARWAVRATRSPPRRSPPASSGWSPGRGTSRRRRPDAALADRQAKRRSRRAPGPRASARLRAARSRARACAMPGAIRVRSSRPRRPPSPACGLSDATATRGAASPSAREQPREPVGRARDRRGGDRPGHARERHVRRRQRRRERRRPERHDHLARAQPPLQVLGVPEEGAPLPAPATGRWPPCSPARSRARRPDRSPTRSHAASIHASCAAPEAARRRPGFAVARSRGRGPAARRRCDPRGSAHASPGSDDPDDSRRWRSPRPRAAASTAPASPTSSDPRGSLLGGGQRR